jgi:hypothetical protein
MNTDFCSREMRPKKIEDDDENEEDWFRTFDLLACIA